jgi:uncharacterized protein YcbX
VAVPGDVDAGRAADRGRVSAQGMHGDRAFAVVDEETGSRCCPGTILTPPTGSRRSSTAALDYVQLHLLTTATLEHIGTSAARYRPNLVLHAAGHPAVRRDDVGRSTLTVGDVVLRVLLPTPRCASSRTARRRPTPGPCGSSWPRTDRRPRLGVLPAADVYATVERAGSIAVGTTVTR